MKPKWILATFGSLVVCTASFVSAFLLLSLADIFGGPAANARNTDISGLIHVILASIFAFLCMISWLLSLFFNSREIEGDPLMSAAFMKEWGRNFIVFVTVMLVFQLVLVGIRESMDHPELKYLIRLLQYGFIGLPVGIGLLVMTFAVNLSKRNH